MCVGNLFCPSPTLYFIFKMWNYRSTNKTSCNIDTLLIGGTVLNRLHWYILGFSTAWHTVVCFYGPRMPWCTVLHQGDLWSLVAYKKKTVDTAYNCTPHSINVDHVTSLFITVYFLWIECHLLTFPSLHIKMENINMVNTFLYSDTPRVLNFCFIVLYFDMHSFLYALCCLIGVLWRILWQAVTLNQAYRGN